MNELTPISHIDLYVHPDFYRGKFPGNKLSPEAAERFNRCRVRALEVSADPTSVIFYASAYLKKDERGQLIRRNTRTNREAYNGELLRILENQALLGHRFFLFGASEIYRYRQEYDLRALLRRKGFTYNPSQTTLQAYGEWLEACVGLWKDKVVEKLHLNPANCCLNPKLSLYYKNEDFGIF